MDSRSYREPNHSRDPRQRPRRQAPPPGQRPRGQRPPRPQGQRPTGSQGQRRRPPQQRPQNYRGPQQRRPQQRRPQPRYDRKPQQQRQKRGVAGFFQRHPKLKIPTLILVIILALTAIFSSPDDKGENKQEMVKQTSNVEKITEKTTREKKTEATIEKTTEKTTEAPSETTTEAPTEEQMVYDPQPEDIPDDQQVDYQEPAQDNQQQGLLDVPEDDSQAENVEQPVAEQPVQEEQPAQRVFYAQDLVGRRNNDVTFIVTGEPGSSYKIEVKAPSSHKLEADGLKEDTKIAGPDGTVSWSWHIGGRTKPGIGSIEIQDLETGQILTYKYIINE